MGYAIFGRNEGDWEPVKGSYEANTLSFYTRSAAGKVVGDIMSGNKPYRMLGDYAKYKVDVHPDAVERDKCSAYVLSNALRKAERIKQRIEDGHLVDVPWSKDLIVLESMKFHNAHVGVLDTSLVEYYANAEDMYDDKTSSMTPARYLIKFYCMSNDTASDWAARMNSAQGVLMFAYTADDIERVYTSGPDSCMSYGKAHYDADVHPARMYAAGDLAVAYMTAPGNADRITARVVCWPAKRMYGNVYGDGIRLEALLTAHGMLEGTDCMFNGARLLRMEHGKRFIGPYLDCSDTVHDNGHNIIIGVSSQYDNYGAQSSRADGMFSASEDDMEHCQRCEEAFDASEDGSYTVNGDIWCYGCFEHAGTVCEDCEDNIDCEDAHYIESCNATVCEYCYENNYVVCVVCDQPDKACDMAGHDAKGNAICNGCDGEYVHVDSQGCLVPLDDAVCCDNCCEYVMLEDIVGEMAEGGALCTDCAPEFAQLQDTEEYVPKNKASECQECDAICLTDDMFIGKTYGHSYCTEECMDKTEAHAVG